MAARTKLPRLRRRYRVSDCAKAVIADQSDLASAEPNSGVNHEFEQVPIGVAHVDARTGFPTAPRPQN
jgi:hypothetical protein